VEEAQEAKAPTARFIERFSAVYTPIAVAVAALVAVAPPLLLGEDWGTWIYRGLALLLVACPCALVLSTPAAIASGLAVGARRGLLVKGGGALEAIGRVRAVAFDKTGTLTEGRPRVTDVLALSGPERTVLGLAAAVENGSSHPLGRAILERAEAGVVVRPVRHLVSLARDMVATVLVQLEGHGGYPGGQERGRPPTPLSFPAPTGRSMHHAASGCTLGTAVTNPRIRA
jgi:Cd2+/Zn2+-exporting ATPase